MQTESRSKSSVTFYQSIWCQIAEELNLQHHQWENLRSRTMQIDRVKPCVGGRRWHVITKYWAKIDKKMKQTLLNATFMLPCIVIDFFLTLNLPSLARQPCLPSWGPRRTPWFFFNFLTIWCGRLLKLCFLGFWNYNSVIQALLVPNILCLFILTEISQ